MRAGRQLEVEARSPAVNHTVSRVQVQDWPRSSAKSPATDHEGTAEGVARVVGGCFRQVRSAILGETYHPLRFRSSGTIPVLGKSSSAACALTRSLRAVASSHETLTGSSGGGLLLLKTRLSRS